MAKSTFNQEAYELAQESFLLMKKAIVRLLAGYPEGLKNAELGRALWVNGDHFEGNDGWFQWMVLKQMELEDTVEQVGKGGPWRLKRTGKD